jgi:hypothetical protein
LFSDTNCLGKSLHLSCSCSWYSNLCIVCERVYILCAQRETVCEKVCILCSSSRCSNLCLVCLRVCILCASSFYSNLCLVCEHVCISILFQLILNPMSHLPKSFHLLFSDANFVVLCTHNIGVAYICMFSFLVSVSILGPDCRMFLPHRAVLQRWWGMWPNKVNGQCDIAGVSSSQGQVFAKSRLILPLMKNADMKKSIWQVPSHNLSTVSHGFLYPVAVNPIGRVVYIL